MNQNTNTEGVIVGVNSIGERYFIRLSDKPNYFLHIITNNNKDIDEDYNLNMEVKKGKIGAGMFTKKDAESVIKHLNLKNLEVVKATDLYDNDGTLN